MGAAAPSSACTPTSSPTPSPRSAPPASAASIACPVDAITIGPDKVAVVDHDLCYGCGECVASCSYGAITIEWKTYTRGPPGENRRAREKVALKGKEGKVVYLSFVTNVSPDCDCWSFSDAPVVADIGVLASTDIVAIDQAAYDLVVEGDPGCPGGRGEGMDSGSDKFTAITGVDGTIAMRYAEEIGFGLRGSTICGRWTDAGGAVTLV